MLLRSNTWTVCLAHVARGCFCQFHPCHQFLVNFLSVTGSLHVSVLTREYSTLPAKWPCFFPEEGQFTPGRYTFISSVFGCLPTYCRNITFSEISLITAVSQHSPLVLHHSLCQWDVGNCSSLSATRPLSGLVCQENTGHSPANVAQCLGGGMAISVLIGLALRVCRLKKKPDMKNSSAGSVCLQCSLFFFNPCLLILCNHHQISCWNYPHLVFSVH